MTFLSSQADLLGPVVGRAVSCPPSGKDKAVIFKTATATQSKCDFPLQIFCGAREGFPSFRRDNKLQPFSVTYKLTTNVTKAEKSYLRIYVSIKCFSPVVRSARVTQQGARAVFLEAILFLSSLRISLSSTEKHLREG